MEGTAEWSAIRFEPEGIRNGGRSIRLLSSKAMKANEIPTLPFVLALRFLVNEVISSNKPYLLVSETQLSIDRIILPKLFSILDEIAIYTFSENENKIRLEKDAEIYLIDSNKPQTCGFVACGALISGWISKEAWLGTMTCLTKTNGWAIRFYE